MGVPTDKVDDSVEQSVAARLLWGKRSDDTPKRGPKPALNLEIIAAAGIEIADADGLTALTMQRVADALGFTKMALYRYVPGKDELVALMTEAAMGLPAGAGAGGWREKLDDWSRMIFDRFVRHPWALQTTVGTRVMGPNELSWLEQALAALEGTGLSGSEMLDVVVTLIGHVRAIAEQFAAMGDSPEHDLDLSLTALLAGHEERFPSLIAALGSATAAPATQDKALDFGLARILDGVELLMSRRSSCL